MVDDDIVVVAGRTHPIFDAPYTIRDLARRVFCIVYPTNTHLSPIVRKLIDLLREKADADLAFRDRDEG